MPRPLRLAFLVPLLALAACDTSQPLGPPGQVPDEVVAGVNLTALFAPVTADEKAAVRDEWAARDEVRPSRYAYAIDTSATQGDGTTYYVLSGHDRATGAVIHYGLVRVPGPAGATTALPTILICPEGLDDPTTEADAFTAPEYGFLVDQSVQVMMSYRGETLQALGRTFASPAPPDPYDHDVDDALALLDAALVLIPRTDVDRLGAYGHGRGGAVALLAAIRDDRLGAVADLAGPSDFLSDPFRDEAREVLASGSAENSSFPGLAALAEAVLLPLRDSLITVDEARLALLRLSARPFADDLPANLIAHGESDDRVVPLFSDLLANAIRMAQPGPPSAYVPYPAAHDDLPLKPIVRSDVAALFDANIRTP